MKATIFSMTTAKCHRKFATMIEIEDYLTTNISQKNIILNGTINLSAWKMIPVL